MPVLKNLKIVFFQGRSDPGQIEVGTTPPSNPISVGDVIGQVTVFSYGLGGPIGDQRELFANLGGDATPDFSITENGYINQIYDSSEDGDSAYNNFVFMAVIFDK